MLTGSYNLYLLPFYLYNFLSRFFFKRKGYDNCLNFVFLFVKETQSSSDPLSKLGTTEIKEILIEKYKSSEYAMIARTRIQEISKMVSILLKLN